MEYTLKNFKIFDAKGTTFEIEPITLLIGGNNAGKSSMAKSLFLLESFMRKISTDIESGTIVEWEKYTLNFRNEYHQLGAFDHVLNWYAKNKYFEITYLYKSEILKPEDNEIEISLEFVPKINSGHEYSYEAELAAITLFRHGEIFYRSEPTDKDNYINFNTIKEDYWWYMTQQSPTVRKMVNGKKKISYRAAIWGELGRVFDIRMRRNRWIEQKNNGQTFTIAEMAELRRAQYVLPVPPLSILESCTPRNIESKINNIIPNLSDTNKDFLGEYTYVIFNAFRQSEFKTFGEFYRFYERAFLNKLPIPAGFHNTSDRMWLPEYYIIFGTNTLVGNVSKILPDGKSLHADIKKFLKSFSWDTADDTTRFAYIHCLLQSWANVNNYEYNQVPNAIVPELSLAKIYSVMLLEEFFRTKNIAGHMHYVELNRANIRRIYTLFDSQGTGFNRLVEQYISSPDIKLNSDNLKYQKGDYINRWLPRFSHFDEIEFIDAPEGVGFYVYLKQNDIQKRISLADVGYGMTPLTALLLHIELVIMERCNSVYINTEGQEKVYDLQPYYVYIEEPETNLHPNNQALLAELFADAYKNYNICFILETHSEYLIRKLQNMVKLGEIDAKAVAINNIADGKNQPIHIKASGAIDNAFAKGFYDEALNLAIELRK